MSSGLGRQEALGDATKTGGLGTISYHRGMAKLLRLMGEGCFPEAAFERPGLVEKGSFAPGP